MLPRILSTRCVLTIIWVSGGTYSLLDGEVVIEVIEAALSARDGEEVTEVTEVTEAALSARMERYWK